jgi:hypothetical protein
MAYYVFNESLNLQINEAILQAKGAGLYDFKQLQKCTASIGLPNSNTDQTPVMGSRNVTILETGFAPEDAELKAQAEALAEYYTENSRNLHAYLSLPDAQTAGKNKVELDEILS